MKPPSFRSALSLFLLATCLLPLHSVAQPPQDSDPAADQRFWIQTEYLYWWMKGNALPPLVTTASSGPVTTVPLGTTLFGGNSVDGQGRNGGRLSLGYWLNDNHRLGLDASVILIGFNGGTGFSASSTGTSILARPFFNVLTATNDAELIAFPGMATGNISASTGNRLQSVSFALRRNLQRTGSHHLDVLFGYRYFHYADTLTIQSSVVAGPASAAPGTTVAGADRFAADNNFHSGEAGLDGGIRRGPWSLDLAGSVALGDQNTSANIAGASTINGTPFVGDLLALSSNIGNTSQNGFAVLPQINVTGRYSFSRFSASLGYTFLYLNNVLRTGGSIDENVNPNLIPPPNGAGGPANPQPMMNRSGFWAQGLSAGLQFHF